MTIWLVRYEKYAYPLIQYFWLLGIYSKEIQQRKKKSEWRCPLQHCLYNRKIGKNLRVQHQRNVNYDIPPWRMLIMTYPVTMSFRHWKMMLVQTRNCDLILIDYTVFLKLNTTDIWGQIFFVVGVFLVHFEQHL